MYKKKGMRLKKVLDSDDDNFDNPLQAMLDPLNVAESILKTNENFAKKCFASVSVVWMGLQSLVNDKYTLIELYSNRWKGSWL